VLVLRVVQTLRGGNRVSRLLVVVHGDTVCEGPDRPLKPFFYCRSWHRNHDGALYAECYACQKAPEFGIYATNQWNSK
jgi:hypothetical protein